MGWNPVNDLKKAFGKLKHELESTANSAKNSINWVKDQAKKEIYKVKDDCKRWVKDAGETVKKEVVDEVKEAGNTVTHEFDSLKNNLTELGQEIENKGKDALDELEKAKDFVEELPEQIEDVIKKGLKSQIGQGMKKALDYALKKLKGTKVIKRISFQFDFNVFTKILGGSVTVGWSNVGEDKEKLITTIGEWIKKPPSSRSEIVEFIKLLTPDDIDCQASFISVGGDGNEWIDELDGYLSDIGVPE